LATGFDPRSKSIATPFIRRLRIARWSAREWNEAFPSLDGFHSITSLSFIYLPWKKVLPDIRLAISNRFITIVRLERKSVVTSAFSELAQIICTFRSLESLIIGITDYDIPDKASSLLRLPQHLHALELGDSDLTEILEWLCSFGQDLTLRNVCFRDPLEDNHHLMDAFLRHLGPSLQSFRIHFEGPLLPPSL
jgi:hypothetical protein